MGVVSIIGIDLAQRAFQLHGAGADGAVVFRRNLSRDRLLPFLAEQPRVIVAMEACASAHYWGREILAFGHEVRLVATDLRQTVRQAAEERCRRCRGDRRSRLTKRFVAVKTAGQQGNATQRCFELATCGCVNARRRSTACADTSPSSSQPTTSAED